jgi:hypothetical protein
MRVRDAATALRADLDAAAAPAANVALLERVRTALGRIAQFELASLKRTYKNDGMKRGRDPRHHRGPPAGEEGGQEARSRRAGGPQACCGSDRAHVRARKRGVPRRGSSKTSPCSHAGPGSCSGIGTSQSGKARSSSGITTLRRRQVALVDEDPSPSARTGGLPPAGSAIAVDDGGASWSPVRRGGKVRRAPRPPAPTSRRRCPRFADQSRRFAGSTGGVRGGDRGFAEVTAGGGRAGSGSDGSDTCKISTNRGTRALPTARDRAPGTPATACPVAHTGRECRRGHVA